MIKETANFSHSQTQQSQNNKGNRKFLPFLKQNKKHDIGNSKFLTFSKTKNMINETANFSRSQKQKSMEKKQQTSPMLKNKTIT